MTLQCVSSLDIGISSRLLKDSFSGEKSIFPLLLGPFCFSLQIFGVMLDSFNFISVADVSPVNYPFNSVFQFRPYAGVFESVPIFIKKMNWKRIYTISETFKLMDGLEMVVSKGLQSLNLSITSSSKVIWSDSSFPPEYKYYLAAASELKVRNARIVVVLTVFPTLMACSLYDVGMYGPKYVYIFEGVMYFQSNDPMKAPNCTEHKLAEILRSTIFVTQAMPSNLHPEFVDELGMTTRKYEEKLKAKLNESNPNSWKTWFQWRATFYSQTVGTGLVLEKADKKLQSMGTSLGEWLTDGENFQRNGSFIRNLLHEELSNFKYKGLNTYGNQYITEPIQDVSFHQMQQKDLGSDSAASFEPAPVALYSRKSGRISMMKPFQWKTVRNKIPVDSVKKIERPVPLLPKSTKFIAIGLAVVNLILIVASTIYQLFQLKNCPTQPKFIYFHHANKFNLAIGIGNVLTALFLLILSIVDYPSSISCSIATVILIPSLWIVNAALLSKLEIANEVSKLKRIQANSSGSRLNLNSRKPSLQYRSSGNQLSPRQISLGNVSWSVATSLLQMKDLLEKRKKNWKFLFGTASLVFVMSIIWLSVDPFKEEKVFLRSIENNQDDLHIEETSKTCVPSGRASFTAFVVVFLSPFMILLLRLVQVGFLTKHATISVVPEITILRAIPNLIFSISIFGTATIFLFYASHPVEILTAILAIILVVMSINVSFQVYSTFLVQSSS